MSYVGDFKTFFSTSGSTYVTCMQFFVTEQKVIFRGSVAATLGKENPRDLLVKEKLTCHLYTIIPENRFRAVFGELQKL
jgi:hypothetical protein